MKRRPDRPQRGNFPVDRNGDGIIADTGDEVIPNLIAVTTDDGKAGYVWIEDFLPPAPKNPDDVRRQEEAYAKGARLRAPVYEADGATQVGWLTYGPGVAP